MKILIVDDSSTMRRIIINTLSRIGYTDVVEGDNGKSGLERLGQGGVEMIITDWNMPEMDGLEFVKTVRTQNPVIPILMVTALNELGDIERAVQAGADDFLTKPVHRLELTTRVRSLLRVRHLTNQRDRLLAYLEEVDGEAVKSLGLK